MRKTTAKGGKVHRPNTGEEKSEDLPTTFLIDLPLGESEAIVSKTYYVSAFHTGCLRYQHRKAASRLSLILIVLLVVGSFRSSQAQSDSVLLDPFLVEALQVRVSNLGQELETEWVQSMPLGEALFQFSPIPLRSYGPGLLQSASWNGTAARHTRIEWNGLRLNSPFNGQFDLNLLPVNDLMQVDLNSGNSDALAPGALGGNIQIESKSAEQQKISAGINSLQNFSIGTQNHFNLGQNNFLQLASAWSEFKNRYRYDLRGQQISQDEAHFRNFYAQPGLHLENDKFSWDWNTHVSKTERSIPPNIYAQSQSESQRDAQVFSNSRLSWSKRNWIHNWNLGMIYDQLDYQNDSASIDANYQSQSLLSSWLSKHSPISGLDLSYRLVYRYDWARTENLRDSLRASEVRLAINAAYQISQFWKAELKLEQSHYGNFDADDVEPLQLSATLARHLDLGEKNWKGNIEASYNRSFARAGWNDLYWNDGGNPELLDETANQWQLTTNWNWTGSQSSFKMRLTGFYTQSANYMQWLPGDAGLWSPINLELLSSAGTQSVITYMRKGMLLDFWKLNVQSSWTHARITRSESASTSSNYLIYQPELISSISLAAYWNKLAFRWQTQYSSSRPISSDNSTQLPSFLLHYLQLRYNVPLQKNNNTLSCSLDFRNLTNRSIELYPGRPQPGFHVQFGFNYTINSKRQEI